MSAEKFPKGTIPGPPAELLSALGDRVDLICGQMTAAGSAASGALYENMQRKALAELDDLFGADSELVNRILQHRAGSDGRTRFDVIPVADASRAAAAEAVVAFHGGPVGRDSFIMVSIVDEYEYMYTIDAREGTTATEIGDALVAAMAATPRVPVTGSNAAGTVTLTASNAGTVGNHYGLKIGGGAPGVTVAFSSFSGGAIDPVLTGIFDALRGERYTGVAWPEWWGDELGLVKAFLESRLNVFDDILDGVAFHGRHNTYASNKAFVDALNSQTLVIAGNDLVDGPKKKGTAIVKPADWTLAYFMGLRSRWLAENVPIAGDPVAVPGGRDRPGGDSLSYEKTADPLAVPAALNEIYTELEQAELEDSGFTVYGTDRTKTAVVFGRVVTTRKTDESGDPDESLHYLHHVDIGSICREIFFRGLKTSFSSGGVPDEETVTASALEVFRALAKLGLVREEGDAEPLFRDSLRVTLDEREGRVSIEAAMPIAAPSGAPLFPLRFSFSDENGK